MIEDFSKWLEFVPLLDHSNEGVTYASLDKVLSRFGVLTKIFTNQGTKFQELCEKTLIDHCTTSQNHPETNELMWMVQMVKLDLQKYGLHRSHIRNWDL
jgi:hypothetical protein